MNLWTTSTAGQIPQLRGGLSFALVLQADTLGEIAYFSSKPLGCASLTPSPFKKSLLGALKYYKVALELKQ